MTATVLQVRGGIKAVLETVEGLDTIYTYRHASPTPPCATVGWPEIYTTGVYLGGLTSWDAIIPVQVLVSMGESESADRNLSAFLEPEGQRSISAAFDNDTDLGGILVHGQAIVQNVTDIGVAQFADDGIQYLAATFNIEVRSA
jgi:hypothetical protein